LAELKAYGLAFPGAHEKAPWPGHNDVAVNDKTFVYLNVPGEPLGIGCKLPKSGNVALMLPWVKPMEYGMGKSGWVSATPPADQPAPIEMFKEWIDESYRAQAPKKLVARIGTAPPATAAKKPAAKKAAPAKTAKATKATKAKATKTKAAKAKAAKAKAAKRK
ncbi:MAG: MmcQ/YjbR family DNA-binding protein, partial [Kofleriaceae bacterium]